MKPNGNIPQYDQPQPFTQSKDSIMRQRTFVQIVCVLFIGAMFAVPVLSQQTEQAPKKATWYEAVQVNGFISTSYTYNFNAPETGGNRFHIFDIAPNTISLDVAELSLKIDNQKVNEAGFRIDISAGTSQPAVTKSVGWSNTDIDLHQAYLSYILPFGKGLRFEVGKFVTPMGYEVIDGYDGYNDNFSRSVTFGFAGPFTHTGIRAGYPILDNLTATLYVVNGWDIMVENNNSKTVGLSLAGSLLEKLNTALWLCYGPELSGDNKDNRLCVDFIASYGLSDKLSTAIEFTTASGDTLTGGSSASWMGFVHYLRYNNAMGDLNLCFRWEYFSDNDGYKLGTGRKTNLLTFTLTPEYKLSNQFIARADFRLDMSNENDFLKKLDPTKSQFVVGLNFLYSF
jgi:hypothetical protein